MLGLTAHLLVAPALAQEDVHERPWWSGLPVASVQLHARGGELPNESLDELLRVTEQTPLDPRALQTDVATLFQVGGFEAVEAEVEPWVMPDEDNPSPGVIVTYNVYLAPRIERLRVRADRGTRDQQVIDAAGVRRGQVFFDELDGPRVEYELKAWLAGRGYPDGVATVEVAEVAPGELELRIDLHPGARVVLDRLTFDGNGAEQLPERRLRRWARRAGVAEGRPITPAAITDAPLALREALGRPRGGPFGPDHAWTESRVWGRRPEPDQIVFTIDLGPELEIEVSGLGRGGARLVTDTLGIDHRLRLTPGFVEQAPLRVESVLQRRGWLDAKVRVEHVVLDPGHEKLVVDVDHGPLHTLGDTSPDFDVHFTDIDGAEARRQQSELQALFDQASPEVLRRDFYTEEEMLRGLTAAEQYYHDRGYLSVKATLLPPTVSRRASPANAARQLVGQPAAVTVTPQIEVTLGPVTSLESLDIRGAPPELALDDLLAEAEAREGLPFSPQASDALARTVVEGVRAIGYLDADARVQTAAGDRENTVRALILVEPGEQILLRSIVVRGTRHTKPEFVWNQLSVRRGDPLTSTTLDDFRSQLYTLGAFDTVQLDLVGDENARDLVVQLDETARWQFEVRGGFSTDQGLRAASRLTRRNLFGRAHSVDFFAQLGLPYRSADVRDWLPDWNAPEGRGAVRYVAPRFPASNQRFEVDLVVFERRQERTWAMDRTGGGVAVETAFGDQGGTTLRAGGRVETRTLGEVDVDALIDGEPWHQLLDTRDDTTPSRWQESLSALLIHNWGAGGLVSFNTEWVPGLPWSEVAPTQPRTAFLKGEARFSFLLPAGPFQIHLAGRGGKIFSFSGAVPLEDRFRLGGTASLRGFVRDAVGPHNIATSSSVQFPDPIAPVISYATRGDAPRWTPTGGDTTASLSTELLIPFPVFGMTSWEGYAAELFADIGNVWMLDPSAAVDSDLPEWRDQVPPLRIGFGAGVRWDTPIGPLQFDVAINPRQNALLVQGWREPLARMHLTLGALF